MQVELLPALVQFLADEVGMLVRLSRLLGDLVELLGEPLLVQAVRDRQAGRVVGLHHVLVAERDRRRRHRLDRGAAVAPRRVQVAVAAQRSPIHLTLGGDRHLRLGLDPRQVARHQAGERLGDDLGGGVPDAVELLQPLVGGSQVFAGFFQLRFRLF